MSKYEYDFEKGIKEYKKILNGGEADFIPVTTQMAEFCMAYGGYNGNEFFRDPEMFVRGSLDVQQEMVAFAHAHTYTHTQTRIHTYARARMYRPP